MQQKNDTSRAGFETCVNDIAGRYGGSVTRFDYETNGKWARGCLDWPDHERKNKIINLLQAEDVVDLLSRDDVNNLESDSESV
jgi:hypothetical protein